MREARATAGPEAEPEHSVGGVTCVRQWTLARAAGRGGAACNGLGGVLPVGFLPGPTTGPESAYGWCLTGKLTVRRDGKLTLSSSSLTDGTESPQQKDPELEHPASNRSHCPV